MYLEGAKLKSKRKFNPGMEVRLWREKREKGRL